MTVPRLPASVLDVEDVIAFAEGAFTCELGAPWRWADYLMTKPYQTILVPGPDRSRAAASMISRLRMIKQTGGYKVEQRPKLWWRWQDRVRLDEDGDMVTRIYVDGNPGADISGNPSKPRGRPTVGQMRLAAA
jgi:hypothetical protein